MIFVCFLPLLVGFCSRFLFFSHFCLFFSHLSSNLSISRTGQLGRKAWYCSLAEHMPPPGRKIFWQEGIEFWQDEVVVAPPQKCPRYAYGSSSGSAEAHRTVPRVIGNLKHQQLGVVRIGSETKMSLKKIMSPVLNNKLLLVSYCPIPFTLTLTNFFLDGAV